MDSFLKEFMDYFSTENKEKCVKLVLEKLSKEEIDIVTLYTKVLAPSLNQISSNEKDQEITIWQEHVRSSIVRTIIECCYPYIIKERDESMVSIKSAKVMVLCTEEEYHEIGARMVADFFTLCGYKVMFVGANTPKNDFLTAVKIYRPKYIAISVTNYYNLVVTKKTIDELRKTGMDPVKILVGGHAFQTNKNMNIYKEIGADKLLNTFQDICLLAEEDYEQ